MRKPTFLNICSALAVMLLVPVGLLWSWNILTGLLGLPLAQYRHALAACFLLLVLRWVLSPRSRLSRSARRLS